jgi:hypothetical protein
MDFFADADYLHSATFGSDQHNLRLSAGLVFRFNQR